MKQRFSSLDVKVIAHELSSSLCTLRLANVYDLSSRIFLFKFAKPGSRQQMVVDSGFRCHLTSFVRATATTPSVFVARLRKILKTRRVTKVSQVGTDRVIELQFSEGQYRLFLEFYAGGNIILTDQEHKILALLRVVPVGQNQEELRIGLRYDIEKRQNYDGTPPLTEDRVKSGLQNALTKAKADKEAGKKQKKKLKEGDSLLKALASSVTELPPPLLEHALLTKKFPVSLSLEEILNNKEHFASLMVTLVEARLIVEQMITPDKAKGYIVAKLGKSKQGAEVAPGASDVNKENLSLLYEDFHPFRPKQFEDTPEVQILELEGFNKTVDEFYSSMESQKLESRLNEREEHAKRKLQAARLDHERRLGGLQQVQELNVRKAQAIEGNLARVSEAIAAMNGLIAQGMDWIEIARLIEMEQARQNPVAEIIELPLKLHENTVTLLLGEDDAELEEEEVADETDSGYSSSEDDEVPTKSQSNARKDASGSILTVDIDLGLSPWSNARQYYDQKKTAAVKEEKTMKASEMALKSTERKVNADLKKGLNQEKQILRPVRKQLWFEKFFYFISSEGYLVLGGRDAQQNEILYKKYLSKGDVYVHADLQGASSVIIKNKPGLAESPIPPSTLSQAGTFSVATSSAWDSKAVMAAWWVNEHQVSKIAETGEYLGTGTFIIRGQKNFLPPAQLLLGFGVMFRVSDESKARHMKHRLHDDDPSKSLGETSTNVAMPDPGGVTDISEEQHDEASSTTRAEAGFNDTADTDSEGEISSENDGTTEPQYSSNPLQSQAVDGSSFEASNAKNSIVEKQELSDDQLSGDLGQDAPEEDINTDELIGGTANLSIENASTIASEDSAPLKQNQVPQVRGKRGKNAKLKSKYAHQDEEDRALALRLLGSTAGHEKAKAEAEKKATREADAQAAKERRREQHKRTQQSGKDAEKRRRLNMEEGLETLDEDEIAELSLVDSFVGTTLPGDEILDCLVVCAPWDAMGSRFKWRIKLQPGAQKKGKAVKEILGHWSKIIADREKKKMPPADDERYPQETVERREGEFIKGLREAEIVGIVPVGKVRMMISGGKGPGGDKGKGGKGGAVGGKGGGRGGKGSKKAR